jgi:hypothetical protein
MELRIDRRQERLEQQRAPQPQLDQLDPPW